MAVFASATLLGGSPTSIGNINCSGFAPCGRSTGYANEFTVSSVSAGPVVNTSVDTAGWSDGIAGYSTYGGTLLADVSATLTYTFAVVGPTQMFVPVVMTGAMTMNAGFTPTAIGGNGAGSDSAHAYLRVADNYPYSPHYVRGDAYSATCDSSSPAGCNTGFTLHTTLMASTASTLGEVAWVELAADSSFYVSYGLTTFASATVDPLVQIDPAFLAAHPGYSLVFADGVSNQMAAVPEGGTAGLLMAGLAVIGAALRAQRRRPSPTVGLPGVGVLH